MNKDKFLAGFFFCWGLFLVFAIILLVGNELNNYAIIDNGCRMPVYGRGSFDEFYSFNRETMYFGTDNLSAVNSSLFIDRFEVEKGTASLGDFFIWFGRLGLIICVIVLFLKVYFLYFEKDYIVV